jgi:hypothetical protein
MFIQIFKYFIVIVVNVCEYQVCFNNYNEYCSNYDYKKSQLISFDVI